LNKKLGTTLAEIQVTFSLLIVISTFCSPLLAFRGFRSDRFTLTELPAVSSPAKAGDPVTSGAAKYWIPCFRGG